MYIAYAVFDECIPYITIYMSAKIIDELIYRQRADVLTRYVFITVGTSFCLYLLKRIMANLVNRHSDIFFLNLSKAYADKAMQMDYDQIEKVETRRLQDRIKMELRTGHGLMAILSPMLDFAGGITQVIASGIIVMPLFTSASVSVWSRLCAAAGIALVIAVDYYVNGKSHKIFLKMCNDAMESNTFGDYYFNCMENYKTGLEFRMYHMKWTIAKNFAKFYKQINDIGIRAYKKRLKFSVLGDLMHHVLQFGAYAFVIGAVLSGDITIGSIAKCVSATALLAVGVQSIVMAGQDLVNNYPYMETFFSYFDIPSKMYQGTLPVEKRAFCDGGDNDYEIEFRDVSFKYPGTESFALRHVSLKFCIGERMAIVGQNGSGKTTFIKLLCRLYDPTEGQILLNGIDIRKYDYDEYISVFAMVFQDFKLFSFPLGQNVASGMKYDEARVKMCLEKAGFTNRLEKMPNGLETCLYKDFEENGVEISGGEAQKIALARALYKDAPFIILDEPTAALDPIAEFEIYSKFNEIVENKTAIYISHRLSSCRFCNDIAVFDQGQIVQRGNHDRLIGDENGKYYELWTAQAQYYAETA